MTGKTKDAIEHLAFIGLGRMGRPMAMRLLAAGFDLTCFDSLAAASAPLVEAGARAARSPAEAARRADVLVTMLPGGAAVREARPVAEAFGVDPDAPVDVLDASTGRNNATEVKEKPHILSGSFASGFALALMAKDLRTAVDLAAGLDRVQELLSEQAQLWARALAALGQQADHTEIFRFLQRLEIRPAPELA